MYDLARGPKLADIAATIRKLRRLIDRTAMSEDEREEATVFLATLSEMIGHEPYFVVRTRALAWGIARRRASERAGEPTAA